MDLDEILLNTEEGMDKAADYLKAELRGVRTGRASTSLVEHVKVDYYDTPTDLRQLALISVPEPSQILIKPFDVGTTQEIIKAIQNSGMGLNPTAEAKQIRVNIPPLSGERRSQLTTAVRQMGEKAKVTIRNARRDGNKRVEQAVKDKSMHLSEDDDKQAKQEIQDLVKQYEKQVDDLVAVKSKELSEF
jgi:ribosome recycling factor